VTEVILIQSVPCYAIAMGQIKKCNVEWSTELNSAWSYRCSVERRTDSSQRRSIFRRHVTAHWPVTSRWRHTVGDWAEWRHSTPVADCR